MQRLEYTKVLLSRFVEMDEWHKYHLISCLIQADSELHNDSLCGKVLDEWSQTVAEALFPEIMGDIVLENGEMI